MLELRRLALLHQFAALKSIAAVAAATGYSASAVSQQLAVLEKEAGVALLERSARSAALTEAGQRLATHAATILDAAEAAEADLARAADDTTGRIVVSTIPTVAVAVAPRLVKIQGPQVVLRQYVDDEALERLRTREVDIAVIDTWRPTEPEPGLLRTVLTEDPLVSRPGFDGDIEHPEDSLPWRHHGSTPTSCGSE
ncbi:LysR family transcriptional regulator, partial [Kutzneria sp. NPDC051319]|uniref:LysR family transcriptional regulator n=1 Tax=Kutzneria sp. NPDC051319 TaxID=3155047 RepID=UPI00341780EE